MQSKVINKTVKINDNSFAGYVAMPYLYGLNLFSTQHTAHSTQHTAHSTQHTAHSTQHTAHSTQHT